MNESMEGTVGSGKDGLGKDGLGKDGLGKDGRSAGMDGDAGELREGRREMKSEGRPRKRPRSRPARLRGRCHPRLPRFRPATHAGREAQCTTRVPRDGADILPA
ncbi:MAG: hypothetical protein RI967_2102 [Planctomycetota bacterium]